MGKGKRRILSVMMLMVMLSAVFGNSLTSIAKEPGSIENEIERLETEIFVRPNYVNVQTPTVARRSQEAKSLLTVVRPVPLGEGVSPMAARSNDQNGVTYNVSLQLINNNKQACAESWINGRGANIGAIGTANVTCIAYYPQGGSATNSQNGDNCNGSFTTVNVAWSPFDSFYFISAVSSHYLKANGFTAWSVNLSVGD